VSPPRSGTAGPLRGAPLVSVVVPTHDRPALLREALASLAAQTLGDLEALVVNDAGADVSAVVARFPFASLLEHAENRGLAAARNTALRSATGRYVAYLDDDDVFLPRHLELLVGELERTGAAVAYSDAIVVRLDGERETGRSLRPSPAFSRDRYLYENLFPVICGVHRRDALDGVGLFDEELSTPLEDWELWLRLSRRHDFVHVPVATVEVRERRSGRISTAGRDAFRRNARAIFARYEHLTAGRPDLRRLQEGYLAGLDLLERRERSAALRVTIVIPAHGNLELTRGCLEAIERTAGGVGHEVVVVDNGSPDGTAAFLREAEAAGRLRAVLNAENAGFARACNQGAALARGDLVCFLNNDTIPHPGWLEALVAAADADPHVGVAGARLLYPDGTIQHAGIVVGERGGEPCPRHVHLCHPGDAPHVTRSRELQLVTGACLLVRRSLFERAGGFDEGYWNGHEDLDLCLKARAAGFRVLYCADAVLTHLESRTKRLLGLEQFHYAPGADTPEARGRRRFLERWGGVLELDERRVLAEDGFGEGLHVLFTMVGWADEGGGTILPRQIAKALVRRGHRVTVLYAPVEERPGLPPYHLEASVEDGVHLLALFNRPARFNDPHRPDREVEDPAAERVVERLVAELRPDVAHLHSLLGFSMAAARALDEAGVPTVFTSHNYWPLCPRMYLFRDDLSLCDGPTDAGNCAPCLGRPGAERAYAERREAGRELLSRRVDRHLAVSARVRELYLRAGHDPARVHVLHQQPETVDAIWRAVGSRRTPAQAEGRPLRVGFIGSLYPHKGAHVLVAALQELPPGTAEAHLFGGGSPTYAGRLRELDRAGAVRLHGGYDPSRLPQLLALVDCVCVPSVWEDCAPLVVAEALAARVPVVASRIGGIPDFVAHGETGLLVPPGDPAALAAALRALACEPGLLERLQAAIGPPRGFDAYLDDLLAHYEAARSERAARARRVPGTRRVAVLASADDLVAHGELLRAYARAFTPADDATLVIDASSASLPALERALAAAGLDGEDAPDMLALVDTPPSERLAERVDAVLRPGTDGAALARLARRARREPVPAAG